MTDGSFGNSASWSGGTPAFDGSDTLIFDLSQTNFAGQQVTAVVDSAVNGGTISIIDSGSGGLLISNGGGTLTFNSLTDNSTDNVKISAALAGGCVTVNDGTLTLTGLDTYTGRTTIASGATLQLGDGTTDGSITSSVVDFGSFVFDNTDCTTFTAGICGTGSVTVENGMVTLGGSNTYCGTTTVTNGARLLDMGCDSFSANSGMMLTCGGQLSVGSNESILSLMGDCSTTVCIASGANLVINTGSNSCGYAGDIMGCGSLEIGNNAYQILTGSNTYSGGTTIDCMATLQLGDGSTNGTIANGVVDNGTLIFDNTGCTTFCGITGSGAVTIENGMVTLLGSNCYSGTTKIDCGATLVLGNGTTDGTISGTSSVVDFGTFKFDNSDCTTFTAGICGTGSVTVEDGMVTLGGCNTYSGTTTVTNDARLLDMGCDSFSANSGMMLTCGGQLSVGSNESILSLMGDCTTTVCIASGANLVINTGSNSCGYAGDIMGCGSLEIGNNAYQILTGSNTYSGGTTIDCMATLQLGDGSTSGTIANGVTDNGTLVFDNTGCTTFCGITGSGAVTIENGMVTLLGSNCYSGTTKIDCGATLVLGNGSTDGSITSSVVDFGTFKFDNSDCTTFTAGICGTGSVTIENGMVTLGGSNTYSGTTTVTNGARLLDMGCDSFSANSGMMLTCGGQLSVGSNESILSLMGDCSTTVCIASGANLLINTGNSSCGYAGDIMGSGSLEIGTCAYQILTGSNTYTGGTTIDCMATLQLGNGEIDGSIMGPVIDYGTLAFNLADCGTFCGPISGTGSVVINSGMVTLMGDNSYSGGTTLENGTTLNVTNCNSIGTGCLTTYSTFCLPTTLAASGGAVALSNNISVGGAGLTLNTPSSPTLTLSGNIHDLDSNDSLVINGPVVLSGTNNTYTGGTTINGATVTMGSDNAFSTGPVNALATGLVTAPVGTVINAVTSSPVIDGLLLAENSAINFAAGSSPTLVDMQSNTSADAASEINLGNDTPTTLHIQVDEDPDFYGTISGNGSLVVTTNSSGELNLYGANTYTGTTEATAGTLIIASNNSAFSTGQVTLDSGSALGLNHGVTITNPLVVNDGAGLGGYGTINSNQGITIQNGSAITGGTGVILNGGGGDAQHLIVGTLAFGANTPLTLGNGGTLDFSIQNATGTSGTDFSLITAGNVNVAAGGAGQFTIEIIGVDSTGLGIGTANTFNPLQSYQWTLISANSLTFTGGANPFAINTQYFSNAPGSGFSVEQVGNDLDLNFTPVPEPSTWALVALGVLGVGGAGILRRRRRA